MCVRWLACAVLLAAACWQRVTGQKAVNVQLHARWNATCAAWEALEALVRTFLVHIVARNCACSITK